MQLFGYPMPARPNDFLTHHQVLEYLTSFAEQAELAERIAFSTRVIAVEPREYGGFQVTAESRSGERLSRDYEAVVVATGCHSKPKWPRIPGFFNGKMMHACEYRIRDVFLGKRVVVAGFGASGADIACDAVDAARSVILSTRSGGYLVPRYVHGRPRDQNTRAWLALLPRAAIKLLWRLMLYRRSVSPKVCAVLERGASSFAKPAVINDHLATLIDADRVAVKPGIERFEGNRVVFSDGSFTDCDLLVCATGYEPAYSFFSPDVAGQNGSFVDRYLRVVAPDQPDLYFVGRISVVGAFFPVLERQAMWVADLIGGRCVLPEPAEMKRRASKESKMAVSIYPDAGRREDTVEYYPYLRALSREHRAGLARRPRANPALADRVVALDPDFSS